MARIPVIDCLRGLAIVGVIFHHTLSWRPIFHDVGLWAVVSSNGWLGVNLFFVLSGFVLYLPFATGDRTLGAWQDIREFYLRRAMRLLPLYYFSTLILLVFYTQVNLGDRSAYVQFFHFVFATFSFSAATFSPAGTNWVLWSLGVEIWFSVLFPMVLWFLRSVGWRNGLITIILVSVAARVIGQLVAADLPRTQLNFISDSVIGRLDEFALGMFAAHLYTQKTRILPGRIGLLIAAPLMLLGMFLWSRWMVGEFAPWSAALFNVPLDLGMTLGLLVLVTQYERIGSWLAAWPLQLMGLMCYSLYLWHGVAFLKLRPHMDGPGTYAAYLVLVFLISWFTYRYIEFRSVDDWRRLLPARNAVRSGKAMEFQK